MIGQANSISAKDTRDSTLGLPASSRE
jgi:hypothetical protein